MATKITQNSWTTGEVDPLLLGRFDVEQYHRGALRLENFVVKRSGALKRRPGTDLMWSVAGLGKDYRAIPFVLDRDGGYIVIFTTTGATAYGEIGNTKVSQVVTANGPWPYTTAAALSGLHWCQSGDTVFLACQYASPCTLIREANGSFSLSRIDFVNSLPAPSEVVISSSSIEPGSTDAEQKANHFQYYVSSVINGVESLPTDQEHVNLAQDDDLIWPNYYYRWLDGGKFTLAIYPPSDGTIPDYYKVYRNDTQSTQFHDARFIGRTEAGVVTGYRPSAWAPSDIFLRSHIFSLDPVPGKWESNIFFNTTATVPQLSYFTTDSSASDLFPTSVSGGSSYGTPTNPSEARFNILNGAYPAGRKLVTPDNADGEKTFFGFCLHPRNMEEQYYYYAETGNCSGLCAPFTIDLTRGGATAMIVRSVKLFLCSAKVRFRAWNGHADSSVEYTSANWPTLSTSHDAAIEYRICYNMAPYVYVETTSGDGQVTIGKWAELRTGANGAESGDLTLVPRGAVVNDTSDATTAKRAKSFIQNRTLPLGYVTFPDDAKAAYNAMQTSIDIYDDRLSGHGGVASVTLWFCRRRTTGDAPPDRDDLVRGFSSAGSTSYGGGDGDGYRDDDAYMANDSHAPTGSVNQPYVISRILFEVVDDTAPVTFTDPRYSPGDEIPRSTTNPFDGRGKWPSHVSLYQQRLVFAGTEFDPNRIWFSRIGDLYEFYRSLVAPEDDPIEFALPVMRGAKINHMLLGRELFLFCGTSEWIVHPSQGLALTYKTILADNSTNVGSSDEVAPILCGNDAVYVTGDGASVMCFMYGNNGYSSQEISAFAQHLFRSTRVVSWAWQQFPDSVLWCVCADGSLLSCTYVPGQQIVAWARHTLGGGYKAEQIVATDAIVGSSGERNTSEVYLVVRKTVSNTTTRHIFRFRQDEQLDSDHGVVADAVNGTNDDGEEFVSTLVTMPLQPRGHGAVTGDVKNVQAVAIHGICDEDSAATVSAVIDGDAITTPQAFTLPGTHSRFHSRATVYQTNTADGVVRIDASGTGDLELHSVDLFATFQTQ